jgi:phospholipid/cholesterol/gamma-HCH transport system permease protein
MPAKPAFTTKIVGERLHVILTGEWTINASAELERAAREVLAAAHRALKVTIDLDKVERIDTAGAWLVDRVRTDLMAHGIDAEFGVTRNEFALLLSEAKYQDFPHKSEKHGNLFTNILADVGETVAGVFRNLMLGVTFLGEVMQSLIKVLLNPARFRATSVVYHIEAFAFRSLPIIALINFLVGCIVAQQSIFQLQKFGAATFAVDLIGILALRELAVLLTSIMIAGRSGSAITAELGSMKMREEIDALRVMGLNPVDVLVMPRILALLISLPLLTFVADIASIFGGLLVAWGYGGISPEVFLGRLQSAIALNTFMVGMIKAPFMAMVIGMIAAMEGLATQGSAESLGRQVTASVVKSIFMVIVVDGIFAMFFAAIRY